MAVTLPVHGCVLVHLHGRVHDRVHCCVRAVNTAMLYGPSVYTAVYVTGRLHGPVHDTAVYTTSVRAVYTK